MHPKRNFFIATLVFACLVFPFALFGGGAKEEEGSVTGAITEQGTAFAIAGAEVSAGGEKTSSDKNGSYKLVGVPGGSQTLTIVARGYKKFARSIEVSEGTNTIDVQLELGEPVYGGEFITFVSSDPQNMDPALISFWDQVAIAANLHEGLLRLSPKGTEIEAGIAESWKISSDGTTFTFMLRRGAKFHNGREITAEDFKYSFERVLDPTTKSPRAWTLDKIAGADEFKNNKADSVSGITVKDKYTLELKLKEPYSPFFSMLASINLSAVPKEEVAKHGEEFGRNAVGAGPFKIGEWKVNQNLRFDAFEDYWNGRPYLDSVNVRIIQDENTRMNEFYAGNLDMAWIPPAFYDRIKEDPVLKDFMGRSEGFHTEFIVFNLKKAPFGDNLNLRKAIGYSINRQSAVDFLQGRASIAYTVLPPGLLGYDEGVKSYEYDVAKAKELMKQAGYPNGLDEEFEVIIPNWSNAVRLFEIYQTFLQEIGVKIKITPLEFTSFLSRLESGDFTLGWTYRVADYADPDSFFLPLYHSRNIGAGGNVAQYQNNEVDRLIELGAQTVDQGKREEIYTQIGEKVLEDVPYFPLFHNIWVDISKPYIKNYRQNVMDTTMYHRAWTVKQQ
jgi:ABC-type transport system substrate-binding protein